MLTVPVPPNGLINENEPLVTFIEAPLLTVTPFPEIVVPSATKDPVTLIVPETVIVVYEMEFGAST